MAGGLLDRWSRWAAAVPWTGAAAGAGVAAGLAWLAVSHALFWPAYGLASFLLGAAAGLLPAVGAGAGVYRAGRRIHRGAAALAGAGAGAGVLLAAVRFALGEPAPEAFAGLVAISALAGAATAWLARRVGRAGAVLLLVLGVAAAGWLGFASNRPRAVPDPSALASVPGPYATQSFRYGSGDDRRRPEYAAAVDRVTAGVDASGLLPGWSGVSGWLRSRWWGFGPEWLPVNGRAWVPEGDGPFPLVLVVHGNHAMEEFSDAGYAYLGEHLASRGFIVASVDENFLNRSFFADLLRPWRGDLEARAGLLLEHLARWRRWSRTPGDPLEGRVDLDRVALVGHSRGGEAVVLATRRNRDPLLGADGAPRFAHGFGIRAVVALAPLVGHARPDHSALALEDVSYLVLHGSHDGDLRSFEGARQLEAVRFTQPGSGLKVAVWIEGANHGQFNRDWGATDLLPTLAPFVVREKLLSAREQERVTEVLLEAFLGAVLQDERRFEPILRDPQHGAALPSSVRLRVEFQEAGFRLLADFEEEAEPTAPDSTGADAAAAGLRVRRVDGVEYRWQGDRSVTRALHLGWQRAEGDEAPHYAMPLAPDTGPAGAGAILAFSLADADYARVESGRPAPDEIDLSLELEDAAGVRSRLPLSRFGSLRPLYDEPMFRPERFDPRPEIVFQGFELPLAAFTEANPRFDPTKLHTLRFVFDRTESGLLVLDDIGWRARR